MTSCVFTISDTAFDSTFNLVVHDEERKYLDEKFWQFEQNPTQFLCDYLSGGLKMVKKRSIPVYDKVLSNILIRGLVGNNLVNENEGKILIDKVAIQKVVFDLANLIDTEEKIKKTEFIERAKKILAIVEKDEELLIIHKDLKKQVNTQHMSRLSIVLKIIETEVMGLEE
jgi:hypothetical protein